MIIKLPPMIGYLGAGFALNYFGVESFPGLNELSELGISLLLFSIGLKLDLKSLARKEIITASFGQGIISFVMFFVLYFFFIGSNSVYTNSIIAFALTFSSTIFVFQILEYRGDFFSNYGQNSIGVLVIQDIMAVLFMAFTANKIPSAWLILLISMLWPIRIVLSKILEKLNNNELLVLFGLTVAVGGAYLFDLVNVKGDLGALILGLILSKHTRSADLNRSLISFKDFFLLGFFLSVGMSAIPNLNNIIIAFLISLFIPIRSILYFIFFSYTKKRNRESLITSFTLSNFSEFGLIVVSFAVGMDLLDSSWLTILSLALAFSFIFSAILNRYSEEIYLYLKDKVEIFEEIEVKKIEEKINLKDYNVVVIGMGRVGLGAYKSLLEKRGWTPIGLEISESEVDKIKEDLENINIIHADATTPELWERIQNIRSIKQVILAMPILQQNIQATKLIREKGFKGSIASVAKYENDEQELLDAGVDKAFNLYAEAGSGLANKACSK